MELKNVRSLEQTLNMQAIFGRMMKKTNYSWYITEILIAFNWNK